MWLGGCFVPIWVPYGFPHTATLCPPHSNVTCPKLFLNRFEQGGRAGMGQGFPIKGLETLSKK